MTMDELPEVLTRLTTRLDALENRVALLEHPSEVSPALPATARPLEIPPPSAGESLPSPSPEQPSRYSARPCSAWPGAYLLRAVAESGSFPKLAAVALAIAYAAAWLIWARPRSHAEWFASTTYAGTSALILAPMLWELTLRFKVLSPAIDRMVLAAFVLHRLRARMEAQSRFHRLGSRPRYRRRRHRLVDRHPRHTALPRRAAPHGPPHEAAACRNRWLSVRPIVAASADIAAWILLYIYSSPDRNLADYANLSAAALLAPAIALFLIYGISVALRTILLRHEITIFETGQAASSPSCSPPMPSSISHPPSALPSSACSASRSPSQATPPSSSFAESPDHATSASTATWSLALFLLGSFLCLPPLWLASGLGVAALLATLGAVNLSRLSLAFHGLIYLCAAAFASGLLQYTAHAVAGDFPAPPEVIAWAISAAIVLCYAIGGKIEDVDWKPQLFHTLSAALAVSSAATVLVSAIVWLTATVITPGSSHVAVIRTLTACALALALAWLGPRWRRVELVWLAYATLAAVAAKLLFEDLRQGHPEFIAASIFLFAVTLILIPRLARRSSTRRPESSPTRG